MSVKFKTYVGKLKVSVDKRFDVSYEKVAIAYQS